MEQYEEEEEDYLIERAKLRKTNKNKEESQ